jgi:hypothetical protein
MTMKNVSQYFFIGVLLIIGLGFFPAYSVAQDAAPDDVPGGNPLLEGAGFAKKQYLVQLSGTVMNETFSGAQALLTLSGPVRPGRRYSNPYLIIIEGFPKQNSINSFYWDSEDSEMWALANEITCDIKRSFVKLTSHYFYSLSPELLRHTGALDAKAGDEGKKLVERVALPTLVNARAGKLKLRIHSNSVSGTVWMKGYDPVEKSYVQYNTRLYGKKVYGLKPKQDQKKLTTVKE